MHRKRPRASQRGHDHKAAADAEHTATLAKFTLSAKVPFLVTGASGSLGGAVVRRLPRQPGRREARYVQLLTGEPAAELAAEPAALALPATSAPSADQLRLERLEQEVRALRAEFTALRGY